MTTEVSALGGRGRARASASAASWTARTCGEVLAIVGFSSSGKITTMGMLLGALLVSLLNANRGFQEWLR